MIIRLQLFERRQNLFSKETLEKSRLCSETETRPPWFRGISSASRVYRCCLIALQDLFKPLFLCISQTLRHNISQPYSLIQILAIRTRRFRMLERVCTSALRAFASLQSFSNQRSGCYPRSPRLINPHICDYRSTCSVMDHTRFTPFARRFSDFHGIEGFEASSSIPATNSGHNQGSDRSETIHHASTQEPMAGVDNAYQSDQTTTSHPTIEKETGEHTDTDCVNSDERRRKRAQSSWKGQYGCFQCHHCNKLFVKRVALRLHLLTHSPKRYECTKDGCDREYKRLADCKRHIDSVSF